MTKARKKILILFLLFIPASTAFAVHFAVLEYEGCYNQKTQAVDIMPIITKGELNENDYKTLFYQTGLGRAAIDPLLSDKKNGCINILRFQSRFLSKIEVKSEFIFPTTKSEYLKSGENLLVSVKDGYILVTKACHTLGWRHGHAAIVTDAASEQTLESILIGSNSEYQTLEKWRHHPTVIILKPKGLTDEQLKAAAEYAKQSLNNIPYDLFAGFAKPKDKKNAAVKGTQCSHLVWKAYERFGINIDSTGGLFVTPRDIALSPELEVVQIIGVNPDDIW